jgi:hypothetical protein
MMDERATGSVSDVDDDPIVTCLSSPPGEHLGDLVLAIVEKINGKVPCMGPRKSSTNFSGYALF